MPILARLLSKQTGLLQRSVLVSFVYDVRPGSLDPRRQPSVIVTIDLASTGFYNRLALFNVLNGSLNRGRLGIYQVSPIGFTFKPLSYGKSSTCTDN
jgi:hypothetical protein